MKKGTSCTTAEPWGTGTYSLDKTVLTLPEKQEIVFTHGTKKVLTCSEYPHSLPQPTGVWGAEEHGDGPPPQ